MSERGLQMRWGEVLAAEDFAFLERKPPSTEAGCDLAQLVQREVEAELAQPESSEIYRRLLERVERPLLQAVLARTEGNQIRAAALLGINRNTLRKKIVELGIPVPGRE